MPEVETRVAGLLGTSLNGPLSAVGAGYTRATNGIARLSSGEEVFVKVAKDDRSAGQLATEAMVLAALSGFAAPRLIGFDPSEPALLIAEAVIGAWPPPYPNDVTPLFEMLAALEDVETPPVRRLEERDTSSWATIAQDPGAFLELGLCGKQWVERALPTLHAAERSFVMKGEGLCHLDVYAANICFGRDRVVLVDWGSAALGNRELDRAAAMVSIVSEGGALPPRLVPDGGALALLAGDLVLHATAPLPVWASEDASLRTDQVRDLRAALGLASIALGMPSPSR